MKMKIKTKMEAAVYVFTRLDGVSLIEARGFLFGLRFYGLIMIGYKLRM